MQAAERHPRYDGFALDLDGVVWLSKQPIPGAPEAIQLLREGGRPTVFVTNDPRATRAELAADLTRIGAPTGADDVMTAGFATALMIGREHPGARVMAIGTDSFKRELRDQGLDPIEDPVSGEGAEVVVLGGPGEFTLEILTEACFAVRAGATLWTTSRDSTYPTPRGLAPGTGAFTAAVESATERRARSAGKPEPGLFEAARERLGCERPLMAGDSLVSDIHGAAQAGYATALVLTGRGERDAIAEAPTHPDHVFDDLAALAAALG